MTTTHAYEVIVIGGGAMGSATAWRLAERGVDAVLLEQFAVGHDRGSSRGPTRIFRHAYADPDYVRLMSGALSLWGELEAASGERLLRYTGAVDIGAHVKDCAEAMREAGIAYERLEPAAASSAFPAVRFEPDDQIMYHADAGICLSARTLAACARLTRAKGVEIREQARVERIARDGDGVVVHTAAGPVHGDVAVLAVGGWATRFLQDLGIGVGVAPSSTHVAYYAAAPGEPDQVPAVIEQSLDQPGWYAYVVPSETPGSGVKIGQFWREQSALDPDERTLEVDEAIIALHSAYAKRRLPTLDPMPVRSES
ncbi:MAG TPA: FAD-dependent oxidoreductase, partial [Solirubrobacteraceae bacterium]|nr:FAD-dependent oxidoreductase [Solirubrobacteraceae bacterium]